MAKRATRCHRNLVFAHVTAPDCSRRMSLPPFRNPLPSLARNVIKLLVERRRGLPFARFRAKLVPCCSGMTLIPSVLVLIVGSELIRNSAIAGSTRRWTRFSPRRTASPSDYYPERQRAGRAIGSGARARLAAVDLASADTASRDAIARRSVPGPGAAGRGVSRRAGRATSRELVPVLDVASPSLPQGASRASAERLAAAWPPGRPRPGCSSRSAAGGELLRGAAPIAAPHGRTTGVVVASDYLTGDLAARSRRMTAAYEDYRAAARAEAAAVRRLRVVLPDGDAAHPRRRDVDGPVPGQAHHPAGPAALRGRAGDRRRPPRSSHRARDARRVRRARRGVQHAWPRSWREPAALERSTIDLERKHLEGEGRRRYIETILERIATGVVSIDARARSAPSTTPAARLLGVDRRRRSAAARRTCSRATTSRR